MFKIITLTRPPPEKPAPAQVPRPAAKPVPTPKAEPKPIAFSRGVQTETNVEDKKRLDPENLITVPFDWNSIGRLNWANLQKVLTNPIEVYRLCFTVKLIPSIRKCSYCGSECKLFWDTRKDSSAPVAFACKGACNRKKYQKPRLSVHCGSFFHDARIGPAKILGMAYWFVYGDGSLVHAIRECSDETRDINNATLINLNKYFREVCTRKVNDSTYIGGPSSTVEVLEFIKVCKKPKGKKDAVHIVVGACRETGDAFLIENESRNVEDFLKIIIQYVQPYTTVVTYCSKFFDHLTEEKWQSMTSGTNLNFMDPKTTNDLQNVKGVYAHLKRTALSSPTGTRILRHVLGFYMWKKKYSKMNVDLYKLFLQHLAELYSIIGPRDKY